MGRERERESSEGTLCIYRVALLNVLYIYMCVCVYMFNRDAEGPNKGITFINQLL